MHAADVQHDDEITAHTEDRTASEHRGRTVTNWVLSLLTIPGALAVLGFAYLQVLGTAACTDKTCAGFGPSQFVFGLITYGTPAVPVAAIVLAFFAARRRLGIIAPACAWVLLVAAFATLALTFNT
jgi:hypothetical protein